MALTWLITLIIVHLNGVAIDPLFWGLLATFFFQDLWDGCHKK